jgi:hypothetical protein
MFCAKCGSKIPDGLDECPACGWRKTVAPEAASWGIKKKSPQPLPSKKKGYPLGISAGCLSAGLAAAALFLAGAVLLFNHRGFAWETWKSSPSPVLKKSGEPESPIMKLRDELLSISAEISGLERGMPYNSMKIARRLEEIKSELSGNKSDPLYFKVFALEKSVEFQFKLTEQSGLLSEVPPLPYTTFPLETSDEYVLKDVSPDMLIKEKILPAGKTSDVRYGPALMSFLVTKKVFTDLFNIDAPKGYKYVEVVVEIEGEVDMVEYTARMLDDYRRAYSAFLGAEKEARKRTLSKNHFLWRDVAKLTKGKTVHLHRIFLMPADCLGRPILEIKRQGASKMLWIQY